jgi:hypothetical protein
MTTGRINQVTAFNGAGGPPEDGAPNPTPGAGALSVLQYVS